MLPRFSAGCTLIIEIKQNYKMSTQAEVTPGERDRIGVCMAQSRASTCMSHDGSPIIPTEGLWNCEITRNWKIIKANLRFWTIVKFIIKNREKWDKIGTNEPKNITENFLKLWLTSYSFMIVWRSRKIEDKLSKKKKRPWNDHWEMSDMVENRYGKPVSRWM